MNSDKRKKTTAAISAILGLSGNLAVRKRVALGLAKSAGLKKTTANQIVDDITRKEVP